MTKAELKKLCNEYLNYNPLTGIITWIKKTSTKVVVGREAGCLSRGYRAIKLKGVIHRSHRLAFLMAWDFMPIEIDHINGIRDDNRLCNLRECTGSENQYNKGSHKNNTSGYKGVSWHNNDKKWHARLNHKGKTKYLGSFNCKHQAAKEYNKAALKYHGEFSKLNIIIEVQA